MPSRLAGFLISALVIGAVVRAQDGTTRGDPFAPSGFEGRWEIRLLHNEEEEPLALLEISGAVGALRGFVLDSRVPEMQRDVKEIVLREGEIFFVLELGARLRFRGKLAGEMLQGSIGSGTNTLAWVGIPTRKERLELPVEQADEVALNDALRIRFPAERRAALKKFLSDFPDSTRRDQAAFVIASTIVDPDERLAAREEFVADYPESRMRDLAYHLILDAYMQEKPLSEDKLLGALEEYFAGVPDRAADSPANPVDRLAQAYHTAAGLMLSHEVLLGKAVEILERAIARVSAVEAHSARATYLTTLGRVRYKLGEFDRAEEILLTAVQLDPDGSAGQAHFHLGRTYEAKKDMGSALDSYLKAAVAIHTAELQASIQRAYLAKHGSLEGLHERMDGILLSRPRLFEPGRFERPSGLENGKVVLAELFTGAECRPCIAADLAFEGILERFDRKTVAVLAYHLHVPGPDPMTNRDAEARAAFYGVGGTPTVFVDGTDRHLGGGLKEGASRNFHLYSDWIERRISGTPPVIFTSLSLTREGGQVAVSGALEIRSTEDPGLEQAGLHLVLAEELLHYTGGNGIHFHHYVVRKILTPPEGLPLRSETGRIAFSRSLSLNDLEQELKRYLDDYAERREDFEWLEDLHAVDPGQVTVVAFVQNRESREVLQASFAK